MNFTGSDSSDPDLSPNQLSYDWDFGDGSSSNEANPRHVFSANGLYTVTLTVSDGEDSATTELTITIADTPAATARVDNPFKGVQWYVDPAWSAKAKAEPGGEAIAQFNTAVWMDRIGAITDGVGLRGHLDSAVDQQAGLFMFVVYDLPNRDCAALASSGELLIDENGMQRYQEEYIKPIVDIISDEKYKEIRIVAIIEVDSLPNLITNLDNPSCAKANGPDGYKDGVKYALNALAKIPNVYSYVDIGHSGWLGWPAKLSEAVDLIGDVILSTDQGWKSVNGFISNTSNYTPAIEPYLTDLSLNIGGSPVKSADFYSYNEYPDEVSFSQAWRKAMIDQKGAPESIGNLIDTARNGWGGPNRPTAASKSTNIDDYVNQSKIDRRDHRGNWCNQPGGIGYRPWAEPVAGIDAFVWAKPPGESDGIADANFTPDPNDPAKRHDPMCDPAGHNTYDPTKSTNSMEKAPHAGRWYPEQFALLLQNAYPPLDEPAGPPQPAKPRTDCDGLSPFKPIVIGSGVGVSIDLACDQPVYVQFSSPIDRNLKIDADGGEFAITIKDAQSTYPASGYFTQLPMTGTDAVIITRTAGATKVKITSE